MFSLQNQPRRTAAQTLGRKFLPMSALKANEHQASPLVPKSLPSCSRRNLHSPKASAQTIRATLLFPALKQLTTVQAPVHSTAFSFGLKPLHKKVSPNLSTSTKTLPTQPSLPPQTKKLAQSVGLHKKKTRFIPNLPSQQLPCFLFPNPTRLAKPAPRKQKPVFFVNYRKNGKNTNTHT